VARGARFADAQAGGVQGARHAVHRQTIWALAYSKIHGRTVNSDFFLKWPDGVMKVKIRIEVIFFLKLSKMT